MNQSKSAFRRYKVIDGLLRNKMRKYPSMNDIIDACWEKLDYQPSKETIQKDIANMKSLYPDGFDAPIHFNRTHLGYEYTDANRRAPNGLNDIYCLIKCFKVFRSH